MNQQRRPTRLTDRHPTPRLCRPQSRPCRVAGAASLPAGFVSGNRVQVLTFSTLVAGPPTLEYVENDGTRVTEEQCLVGWIRADFDKRQQLELYGVDLRFAIHDPKAGRWERCLFSHPVADLLELLSSDGDFPFAFEATPSQAEATGTSDSEVERRDQEAGLRRDPRPGLTCPRRMRVQSGRTNPFSAVVTRPDQHRGNKL